MCPTKTFNFCKTAGRKLGRLAGLMEGQVCAAIRTLATFSRGKPQPFDLVSSPGFADMCACASISSLLSSPNSLPLKHPIASPTLAFSSCPLGSVQSMVRDEACHSATLRSVQPCGPDPVPMLAAAAASATAAREHPSTALGRSEMTLMTGIITKR